MPQYCYRCQTCKKVTTVFRPVADRNKSVSCVCLGTAIRDVLTERGTVRGDYNRPIIAQSMSFDAIDAKEHRRRFPNIEVRTEGRIATPVFRSLSQKRKYLKQRNWVDCRSFF